MNQEIENKRHARPVIVSNRLPIKLDKVDGQWVVHPGTGGLVTALAPVLRGDSSFWVGWPGAPVDPTLRHLLDEKSSEIGFKLGLVELNEEEVSGFYRGFSNEAIWPLFHDLLDHCNFDNAQWEMYQQVNYKFAKAAIDFATDDNFIWVHDYHLMLVGHFLNEMGFADRGAFFLHIPFPPYDIFARLPWRQQILEALLSFRLVGFQTERDRRNFVRCVRQLLSKAHVSQDKKINEINYEGRVSRSGAFGVSIDFKYFNNYAKSKEASDSAWYFHEKFPKQKIIIGIDRLDYTKGIPDRLLAFENCLERYPELRQKVVLVQIVVPSRTEVPEYQLMKSQIDEMVGRINGRFTSEGWVPIHYIFGTLSPSELSGYYKASEIALITPLKDGMNLVSKEYCASHCDGDGILILSEFAGAASALNSGAILVNPYNVIEVADAIFYAYFMDETERRNRMRRMRAQISRNTVFKWVDQFLTSFCSAPGPVKGHWPDTVKTAG